jgi:hypothetical protein
MSNNKLHTYEEIQGYSDSEVGHMIQFDEVAEYVFVWGEDDNEVTVWVTNNICKLEESLFQFVFALEAKTESITKEQVDEVCSEVAMQIYNQKTNGTLERMFQFNKGITTNE